MRKFTSNAITRFFERFNLRASPFHDARPISNFILFSSCVYLIRSASSKSSYRGGSILLEEAVQKTTKSVLPLS
jgi:hypothetical protein